MMLLAVEKQFAHLVLKPKHCEMKTLQGVKERKVYANCTVLATTAPQPSSKARFMTV
jgi:hypothetical protein